MRADFPHCRVRLAAAPAPLLGASELVRAATLACWLEAAAPKPGNVHPGAAFADLTFRDFVACAPALALALRDAPQGVGRAVLRSVRATRAITGANVNLGIALLLAPLAAIPSGVRVAAGIDSVLGSLTREDAHAVYEAIRLANPGGLGRTTEADVAQAPPPDLRQAMALAADRDLVVRQYALGYVEVLQLAVPWLCEALESGQDILTSIVSAQVRLLAHTPDSLIARKCGPAVAAESSARAQAVLAASPRSGPLDAAALAKLDVWLRADGHRRNPGTTADLLAAALYASLRDGTLRVIE